jgi:hypothetical protein
MAWTPLPHEAHLFSEVYIDESSQTKHRYLVLGSLIIPMSHADLQEADVIAARGEDIPPKRKDGTPRVMKWEKVSAYNFAVYKRVFDAFMAFPTKHKFDNGKHVNNVNLVVVDTHLKHAKKKSEDTPDVGFNKEIYFLCVNVVREQYKRELFHVYMDRRTTSESPSKLHDILNFGAHSYGDRRKWPFRRCQFDDPETCQALQVIDIILGAVAFKLNGHYDKPEARQPKRDLCDYIIKKCKIDNVFEDTKIFGSRRLRIVHRTYEPKKR